MWWPKLETKINEILKNHIESSPNELRSERDILEEVLELTRINTKRFPRGRDLPRNTIRRLIENITDLQYRLMKFSDSKVSLMFYEDIRTIIKELCMEMDLPELYERFVINTEKEIIFRSDKMYKILDESEINIDKN